MARRQPEKPDEKRRVESAVRELLRALGLDPDRPELKTTPQNFAEVVEGSLMSGYAETPEDALGEGFPRGTGSASDPKSASGSIAATGIPYISLCPHHLMPSFGHAHVAFIPGTKVPGFGRIARLVDTLAHRLVLQEDLSQAIVDTLAGHLGVRAAACILEARHACVAIKDLARRDVVFRTHASFGSKKAVTSLLAEIDASLRSAWPMSASEQRSPSPDSRSRSRARPVSVAPRRKHTVSRSRRPSR